MGKINLSDVTFLIPARIDSQERKQNLFLVLEFIKNHFNTTIMVLEADKKEQVRSCLIDRKIFIKDIDPIFHHTKYRNQLIETSTTPIIAIWDTDVLLFPKQVIESVNMVRNNKTYMVFPYDGRVHGTNPVLVNIYKSTKDIKVFMENIGKLYLMYGNSSPGGAFIVNKNAYCAAGMENENFYGWGPEDAERIKRWEILGYKIHHTSGALFHLHHPRQNSFFANSEIKKQNISEYLKICAFTPLQLKKYIRGWSK